MKVCDQSVDCLEAVAGIDEDPGISRGGANSAALVGDAFKHAAGGSPDRNDPAACRTACVDLGGNRLRDVKMLGVHQMLLDPLYLNGTEGAKPDVKRYLTVAHALFSDCPKQLRRKMQSRRRRGGRALLLGIDRLIAVAACRSCRDIRGQWHFPDRVKHRINAVEARRIIGEPNDAVSAIHNVKHLGCEKPVSEEEAIADARALPGTHERLPGAVFVHFQKQKLDGSTAFLGHAEQARRNDLGRVDNEHILGAELVYDIRKYQMPPLAAFSVEHQQTRAVPSLGRALRDQLGGKLIVKIRGFQIGRCAIVKNGVHTVPPFT